MTYNVLNFREYLVKIAFHLIPEICSDIQTFFGSPMKIVTCTHKSTTLKLNDRYRKYYLPFIPGPHTLNKSTKQHSPIHV